MSDLELENRITDASKYYAVQTVNAVVASIAYDMQSKRSTEDFSELDETYILKAIEIVKSSKTIVDDEINSGNLFSR